LKIKSEQDFWSGLLFLGMGIAAIVISRDYFPGNSLQMGPGYFPRYVGILLSILGGIITLSSFRVEGGEVRGFGWRAIVMPTLGFLIFGWAIDRIGFLLAMFGMIVCSMLGGKKFNPFEVLITCAVLISGSIALFVYGLQLPFPLFWWR
jgi:Tripartite tricarboxylate transporter TctB family